MQKSESIANLAKALAAAQAEFLPVKKDCRNPFFNSKYADLATVIEAVRSALSKHGLALAQLVAKGESGPIVTTLLMHESGEWLASDFECPASKHDAQGFGSAMTYGRRYATSAILNVASEDDDDANQATYDGPAPAKGKKPKEQPKEPDTGAFITTEQRKRLFAISHNHGWNEKELREVLGRHGFESSSDVTKLAYDAICNELEARTPPPEPF